jgi:hypothetical protein
MSIVDEIWKDIPDYEGYYQVSNLGRVRSLDRFVVYSNGHNRVHNGSLISPYKNHGGYWKACLWVERKMKAYSVHALVMRAFRGFPPDGCEVNHLDGNKDNNSLCNLEYCTKSRNIVHAQETGLKPVGSRCYQAKLSESQVLEIRELYALGQVTQSALAGMYGVKFAVISAIVRRKKWKYI